MMTRKVFQELQVSANNATVILGSRNMTGKKTKELEKICNEPQLDKKENAEIVRRPKRKNDGVEKKLKKTSKEVPKKSGSKSSKIKSKKNATVGNSKLDMTVVLNQSRLESFLTPNTNSSINSEESTSLELGNVTVSKSVSEEIALITSDVPSQTYWQQLAEQRGAALEKTLLENELLFDQINVLQTENLQLKSAIEAAEKVLEMAGLLD